MLLDISQVSQVKNYGHFCPAKSADPEKDAEFQSQSFAALREALSIIQQGKMLGRVPAHRLQVGRKKLTNPMALICTDEDSQNSILDTVALHQSLVETIGEKKTASFWIKMMQEKTGSLILADFFPLAEDFLQFEDPFAALSAYMIEYFAANERAGLFKTKVIENSKDEFRVDVVDCCFHQSASELGHPKLYYYISRGDEVFFPRMCTPVEGKPFAVYERQGCLCGGDQSCDWRYHRYKD